MEAVPRSLSVNTIGPAREVRERHERDTTPGRYHTQYDRRQQALSVPVHGGAAGGSHRLQGDVRVRCRAAFAACPATTQEGEP